MKGRRSASILNIFRTSFELLVIFTLPSDILTASEFDCGINRFNNESPLTERIVGGNNSLQ